MTGMAIWCDEAKEHRADAVKLALLIPNQLTQEIVSFEIPLFVAMLNKVGHQVLFDQLCANRLLPASSCPKTQVWVSPQCPHCAPPSCGHTP